MHEVPSTQCRRREAGPPEAVAQQLRNSPKTQSYYGSRSAEARRPREAPRPSRIDLVAQEQDIHRRRGRSSDIEEAVGWQDSRDTEHLRPHCKNGGHIVVVNLPCRTASISSGATFSPTAIDELLETARDMKPAVGVPPRNIPRPKPALVERCGVHFFVRLVGRSPAIRGPHVPKLTLRSDVIVSAQVPGRVEVGSG